MQKKEPVQISIASTALLDKRALRPKLKTMYAMNTAASVAFLEIRLYTFIYYFIE